MTKTVSEELQLSTNRGVGAGEHCRKQNPWQKTQREQEKRRQEEPKQTCGRAATTHKSNKSAFFPFEYIEKLYFLDRKY